MSRPTESSELQSGENDQSFVVEQYELYVSAYKVIAESAADAVAKVLEGEGDYLEGQCEYIEPCDALGMPVEENEELVRELRSRKVMGDEKVVPTIRTVRPLKEE